MRYRETVKPRLSDIDVSGNISYEAILKLFEDTGTHHSDSANDRIISREAGDLAWILIEWHVELKRRISKREMLNIETWISGRIPSMYFFRNFIMTDASGKEVARAQTKLVLVDISTMKILKLTEGLFRSFDPEEPSAFETLVKIREKESYENTVPLTVRTDDLDFNSHVHNTRYLSLVLNALPVSQYEELDISSFRYVCKTALDGRRSAEVGYTLSHNEFNAIIRDEDNRYMILEAELRNKE